MTIDDATFSPNIIPQHSLIRPRFISVIQHDQILRIHMHNAIVDQLFPVPEPTLTSKDNIFDGWFGIVFKDSLHTTHVRSPHPSEILSLYH